jgi:hypothetical protein
VSHKFASLFLIYYIYFGQIDFIVILENICLRFTNSSDLSYASNILSNQSTRTTFSHSPLSDWRLISILVDSKFRIIRIKLIVLNPMWIDFVVGTFFYSEAAHSKSVALWCQILTLMRLVVTSLRQITRNMSEWIKRRFYYFVTVSTLNIL